MRRLLGTRSQHDGTPRGTSGDVCESRNLPISTTLIQESAGRQLQRWRTPREVSSLRCPAEVRWRRSRETPLQSDIAAGGKGQKSAFSTALLRPELSLLPGLAACPESPPALLPVHLPGTLPKCVCDSSSGFSSLRDARVHQRGYRPLTCSSFSLLIDWKPRPTAESAYESTPADWDSHAGSPGRRKKKRPAGQTQPAGRP